ncbi:hypothetical protein CL653_01555 [bacterium]|nr:hypothetical protein [bacterium]|tara:strand:+ start:757 stop:1338 length:582 start_codon:yes stop_codon:yes gene_type:complete
MYTPKIEKALRAASLLHEGQYRKGLGKPPYVTHLVAVAMISLEFTNEEDIIVAALLHDTIEDTPYTVKELEEDFGEKVCDIVVTLSEPKEVSDWKERKDCYLNQLRKASPKALIVACADKIHNMHSIVDDYKDHEDRFIREFGGSLSQRLEQYQNFANIVNKQLENDIVHEFNRVFNLYKDFLVDIENNNVSN